MNNFWEVQAEKTRILFAKNKGQEVLYFDEHGKKCAKLLHNVIVELVNKNFDEVRGIIDSSFVIKDNMLEKYNDDITSVRSFVAKKEMSYRDFIGIACESIFHENHILFYAMIYLIAHKLNTAQRMFFDDIFCLKGTLKILDKKANLNYPFSYEKDVADIYTKLLLGTPVESTLFYKECMSEYYPIGGILKIKDDYVYKQNSKYNTDKLSLDWVKNDYENCIDRGEMREFIIEVDDYINTVGNKNKSSEMWNYLTEALMCDFLESPFAWNVELSKSIIMSMVGFSKCYNDRDIIKYTTKMREFVLLKLSMIKKIISLMAWKKVDYSKDDNLLNISLFLLNMYYIFPFVEVLDFVEEEVLSDIDYLYDENIIIKAQCDIRKHIAKLRKHGEKDGNKIRLSTNVPDTSSISEVFVDQQSDIPKFSIIYVGLNLAKLSAVKVELSFFNENNQEIMLGENEEEKFIVDLGNDTPEGGYVGYRIPILNCSDINSVKAKILGASQQEIVTSNHDAELQQEKTISNLEVEPQQKIDVPNHYEEETIQLEKGNSKAPTIAISIMCAIVAFIILLTAVVIPNFHYNNGIKHLESGNYVEAIKSFTSAGDFKDVKELLASTYYRKGEVHLSKGEYTDAYLSFKQIYTYKDVKEKLNDFTVIYDKEVCRTDDGRIGTDEYVYDDKGNMIKHIEVSIYDTPSAEPSMAEYVYDDKGNMIKTIYGDGEYSIKYTYDKYGNPIKRVNNLNGEIYIWVSKHTYDNAGKVIKTVDTRTDVSLRYDIKYTYDSHENLIMKERTCDDVTVDSYKYTYDEYGNIIQEVRFDTFVPGAGDDGRTEIYEYTYDDCGNVVQEVRIDENGDKQTDKYTYDCYGNKFKKVSFDSNGRKIETCTYSYEGIKVFYRPNK